MNIPNTVKHILKILEENGYEAYIVGGCVRDSLMNRTPKDWDVTTNALPSRIIEIFASHDIKTIPTGIKYGTVTLLIDSESYEITTYRKDSKYSDGRRPDEVEFSDNLIQDLSRRDFTMNAIAYNPDVGMIDPFNGQQDIKNKIIRTVGNPHERFMEDGLRMFRAVRFSSVLEMKIEKNTEDVIKYFPFLAKNTSQERKTSEFNKIVLSDNFIKNFIYLYKLGLLNYINSSLMLIAEEIEEEFIDRTAQIPHNLELRLAYLLKAYKINFAENILKDLKFSNQSIDLIKDYLNIFHFLDNQVTVRNTKLLLQKLKKVENVYDVLEIFRNTEKEKNFTIFKIEYFKLIIQSTIFFKEPYKIEHLEINGEIIKNEFNVSGKIIGQILSFLLDHVIDKPTDNEKTILIQKTKEYLNEIKNL